MLLSSFVFAETTIYDFVNDVKLDASSYTIVMGKQMDNNEIKAASELASFLGITKSRFDDEVIDQNNLIIVGNPSTNSITQRLLGEWIYGGNKGLVKVVGSNLIIAGSSTEDTDIAINMIKNYEKNKDKLQVEMYVQGEFFSPSNLTLWILVGGVLVGIAILIFLLIIVLKSKKKKSLQKQSMVQKQSVQPRVQQQSSDEVQIYSYIQRNLARGYQKYDLQKSLLGAGWTPSLVQKVLNKFP
jgi:hypothetical protein